MYYSPLAYLTPLTTPSLLTNYLYLLHLHSLIYPPPSTSTCSPPCPFSLPFTFPSFRYLHPASLPYSPHHAVHKTDEFPHVSCVVCSKINMFMVSSATFGHSVLLAKTSSKNEDLSCKRSEPRNRIDCFLLVEERDVIDNGGVYTSQSRWPPLRHSRARATPGHRW
ncbi:hypothetical protein E2C01_045974 [Portunus trituberculatus]|uniref:Uncharacterized protein n=1 Tax=Portunus trituberculatus TaxID=210409 RepID=A0A5B7G4D1_PORTR|nr:hypothetical protein [Portunus trituberculatus]